MSQDKSNSIFFLVIRWLARIIGSLFALFVVFMVAAHFVGESESPPSFMVTMGFASFLVGVILAWIWEGIGGGLLLLTTIVFIIFQPKAFWPPTLLIIFPITAILFLIC